jgi:hypothetical protein
MAEDLWLSAADGQRVAVSGRLRLVGSEHFSNLVITDSFDHDWYIDPGDRAKLHVYEQRFLKVRASVRLQSRTLANGKKLSDQRILFDVELVVE